MGHAFQGFFAEGFEVRNIAVNLLAGAPKHPAEFLPSPLKLVTVTGFISCQSPIQLVFLHVGQFRSGHRDRKLSEGIGHLRLSEPQNCRRRQFYVSKVINLLSR
jgi:hypothetical protein